MNWIQKFYWNDLIMDKFEVRVKKFEEEYPEYVISHAVEKHFLESFKHTSIPDGKVDVRCLFLKLNGGIIATAERCCDGIVLRNASEEVLGRFFTHYIP